MNQGMRVAGLLLLFFVREVHASNIFVRGRSGSESSTNTEVIATQSNNMLWISHMRRFMPGVSVDKITNNTPHLMRFLNEPVPSGSELSCNYALRSFEGSVWQESLLSFECYDQQNNHRQEKDISIMISQRLVTKKYRDVSALSKIAYDQNAFFRVLGFVVESQRMPKNTSTWTLEQCSNCNSSCSDYKHENCSCDNTLALAQACKSVHINLVLGAKQDSVQGEIITIAHTIQMASNNS